MIHKGWSYHLKIWKNYHKETFLYSFQQTNFQKWHINTFKGHGVHNFVRNFEIRRKWSGLLIFTNSRTLILSIGLFFLSLLPDPPSPPSTWLKFKEIENINSHTDFYSFEDAEFEHRDTFWSSVSAKPLSPFRYS